MDERSSTGSTAKSVGRTRHWTVPSSRVHLRGLGGSLDEVEASSRTSEPHRASSEHQFRHRALHGTLPSRQNTTGGGRNSSRTFSRSWSTVSTTSSKLPKEGVSHRCQALIAASGELSASSAEEAKAKEGSKFFTTAKIFKEVPNVDFGVFGTKTELLERNVARFAGGRLRPYHACRV